MLQAYYNFFIVLIIQTDDKFICSSYNKLDFIWRFKIFISWHFH